MHVVDEPRTGIASPLENAELEFDIKLSAYLDIMQTEQSATESLRCVTYQSTLKSAPKIVREDIFLEEPRT